MQDTLTHDVTKKNVDWDVKLQNKQTKYLGRKQTVNTLKILKELTTVLFSDHFFWSNGAKCGTKQHVCLLSIYIILIALFSVSSSFYFFLLVIFIT